MNLYYEHLETLTANKAATSHDSQTNNRSNHSQMFFKIGVLKNFANFTGKHPCQDLPQACNFIKERLQYRCFSEIYAKFLRTPFSQNASGGCFWNNLMIEFVPGHDTGKTAKEMLYISAAITNKVLNILENGNFLSILSDGSQARKTKHAKEMMSIRTERKGIL